MGTEQPASYYDAFYRRSKIGSWRDYRSVRKRLYKAAVGMIEPGASVVDLGCGPGHFAAYLSDSRKDIGAYCGIDFSTVSIRQASAVKLPGNYTFMTRDLMALRLEGVDAGDTFVIMEVLEHITDDMKVLDIVPAGATCIVSVPSFDNDAHVRVFKSENEIRSRYGEIIQIEEIRRIWKWYLFKGIKL